MAFPQDPLGLKIEAKILSSWTDITRNDSIPFRVLLDQGVSITRGRQNKQGRVSPSTCSFTAYDPTGTWCNDNPRSQLFGLLPRNTPIRVTAARPVAALYMPVPVGYPLTGCSATTTDKAALDITGDIDIRIEFDAFELRRSSAYDTHKMILAGKGTSVGNQRSWLLAVSDQGYLKYSFSGDGTNTRTFGCTVPIPATGRQAVKIVHDVDNGAGSTNVQFFTASTIDGTYTLLESRTSGAVASLFSSSGALSVGAGAANDVWTVSVGLDTTFTGRVYAFQLRNSAGTLVASPDWTTQANDTTSFADGLGNTWTLDSTGAASGTSVEISDRDYRFTGELTSVSQVPDQTSLVTTSEFEASGVLARMNANVSPLRSTLYATLSRSVAATAYWPGEDGSTSNTTAGSAVTGSKPASITDISFSSDATLPGTAGVMVLGGTGPVFDGFTAPAVNANLASFIMFFKFPSIPLSAQTVFTLFSSGTGTKFEFIVDAANYTYKITNAAGTVLSNSSNTYAGTVPPTSWIGICIKAKPSGGNVQFSVDFFNVDTQVFWVGTGITAYAGTTGQFKRVLIQGVAALSGVKIAHLRIEQFDTVFAADFASHALGYAGETAAARILRLLGEQGIACTILGDPAESELMGPQGVDTITNLIDDCIDVDGGELFEPRETLGLWYRTRVAMQNQEGSQLSYTVSKHLSKPLKPVPDLTDVANDVTVTRENGSSARVTLETGPMSAADPAAGGIGRVDTQSTLNCYADSRLPALAQYALGLGTWPESRYPSVSVAMHRSAFSFYDATFTLAVRTDIGQRITVDDLPAPLPPGPLRLIVRGYTEILRGRLWEITWNTTPAGPYVTNEGVNTALNPPGLLADARRADSSNTVLGAGITSSDTSASFATATGALCVTTALNPAEFPFNVMIGGELVTVTAITGTTSPQTATITRSVNGVVKAQVINAPVTLASDDAFYVTL